MGKPVFLRLTTIVGPPKLKSAVYSPGEERMRMRRLLPALFTGFVVVLAACTTAAPQGGQQPASSGGQQAAAPKADTTGVTDNEIVIGMWLPLSGNASI